MAVSKAQDPGDDVSRGREGYEKSAKLCEQLEREPVEYRDKYVGIVRGRILVAADEFTAVIKQLQRFEPDRTQHFVVLAGRPQPSVIYNFGLG